MRPVRVEISWKTIIFTTCFFIGLALLWQLRSLILTVFVCFVFMEALNPTIVKLERLRLPRPLAIFLIYAMVIILISFAVAGIVPIIIEQTTSLITTLPNTLNSINFYGIKASDLYSQFRILDTLPGEIAKTTVSIFSNFLSAIVLLVVTFYLLLERKNFPKYGRKLLGEDRNAIFVYIIEQLEDRLGRWVSAEIILMSIIGLLSYFGYVLLNLRYALILALLAGLLEIIPNIGPVITAVLTAMVALTISPVTALLTIGWGILVHQLENNFITPKIMKETTGINPLITILAITAGAQLSGIIGAILAVPVFITIEVIFKTLMETRQRGR